MAIGHRPDNLVRRTVAVVGRHVRGPRHRARRSFGGEQDGRDQIETQAREVDYSGTQGAKALKEEGYRVILVNSNPATIMTDPEFADRPYIEPLTPEILEAISEREKPDAVLPTLGGQTALNLALALADRGILEKHGVELIGANVDAIRKAEERELFKAAMDKIGLGSARADVARTVEEAHAIADRIGYPIILRPP